MRFENKVAVVLGGNSGIGLETARCLVNEGAKVVIGGRDSATLKQAQADTGALLAEVCDISDAQALDTFYKKVEAELGQIDALIVNAGVGAFSGIRDITPELWDQIHDINLRGNFFSAQKALPLMGKDSAIVFTGSIGGVLGLPGNCIYGAAKAGLRAVTRGMAKELVADGIRVNMVSPGPTETPIINRDPGMNSEDVKALRQQMIGAVPMHRMGEAEEVAKAITFLASSDASFITGIDMFVDGGCVEIG